MNFDGGPEVVLPTPGDAYIAFGGVRLVIGQVTPAEITYCTRGDGKSGPPQAVSTDTFLEFLAKGMIEKVDS